MAVVARTAVLLTFLASLWTSVGGGDDTTCDFNTRCILMCSVEVEDPEVIHWHHFYEGDKLIVHSYYKKADHLEKQNQRYRNRTSLVENKNTKRRTSLQLAKVQIQDQGKYECYTASGDGIQSYVNLQVNAPVETVSISREGNRTTCSSEGIYPQPELTWSTEPPSTVTLHDDPTVLETEDQLYNITSSLTLSDGDQGLSYSCNVSTRRNWKKVTPREYLCNEAHIEIPCSASNASLRDFSLIWRFNHSQIVAIRAFPDITYNISDQWQPHVEEISDSGNLVLQHLKSNQGGIYTCELRQAGNGLITENKILITQTLPRDSEASILPMVLGIVAAVFFLIVIATMLKVCLTRCRTDRNSPTNRASNVRYTNPPSDSPRSRMIPLIQRNGEPSS